MADGVERWFVRKRARLGAAPKGTNAQASKPLAPGAIAAAMLPGARSDASMLAGSRDDAPPGAVASDATSAPAVAAWELLDARRTLREWTLSRYLAARPAGAPVVFSADTTIGAALAVRGLSYRVRLSISRVAHVHRAA